MTQTPTVTTTNNDNPYVGPRTFEKKESDRFFGREREARELLAVVSAERLTLFYAQSGAGKSSLINTRLIPGLEKKEFEVLPVGRVGGADAAGQTANPFVANLMRSLLKRDQTVPNLTNLTLTDFLARLVYADDGYIFVDTPLTPPLPVSPTPLPPYPPTPAPPIPRVLIIDQFEEILTTNLHAWDKRGEFFDQLTDAMNADPYLWVVLTLREDYVAGLDPYAHRTLNGLRARYYMQRMGYEAALDAVQRPASEIGQRPFAQGVAEQLVNNLRQVQSEWAPPAPLLTAPGEPAAQQAVVLGETVEPVQLQVVCYQLWENLRTRPGPEITLADLTNLAGEQGLGQFVNRALGDFYEQTVRTVLQLPGLNLNERQVRDWFAKELITENETRSLTPRGEKATGRSIELPNAAVDELVKQFLLRAELRAGGVWYELVHDRFVAPILQANRAWEIAQANPLTSITRLWLENGRDPRRLLRGTPLADAQAYAQREASNISKEEQDFLAECERQQALEQAEAERTEREERQARLRRRNQLYTALAAIAVLAMLAVWALQQRNAAVAAQADADAGRTMAVVAQKTAVSQATSAARSALAARAAQAEAVTQRNNAQQQAAVAATAAAQANAANAEAQQQTRRAKAGELAAASQREVAQPVYDPSLALLLAMQAVTMTHPADGQVFVNSTAALDNAVRNAPPWQMTLQGHTDYVNSAAFSADGQRIVTTSHDNTAKVWDAASGKELLTLQGHMGAVNSAAFSADGQRIVTASWDHTAKVWDAASGKELLTLQGHMGVVWSAAFSADGQRIVTASDHTAKVWDTASGKELLTLQGHTDYVNSAAFSADGQRIVTASHDNTAKVWDAASGKELLTLQGHTGVVRSAAFSADGQRIITASDDHTAKVWDAASGKELLTLQGHTGTVWSAAFSADGQRIVTASHDHTAKVWDTASGKELLTLQGHTDYVNSAAFSADGQRIITASLDNTAKVWDTASGKELLTLQGHTGTVRSAAFSADGQRIVTASWDHTAKVWDIASGKALLTLQGHMGVVRSAAFSADGQRIVTASYDNTAKVWDAASGKELLTLQGHTDYVNSAAFSADGQRIVTASWDNTAKVWDAASGKELLTLQGHTDHLASAAFSADGQRIVTASLDNTAKVWDAASGKELLTLQGHTGVVNSAAFSADGQRIVTASWDHTAKVWDAASGKELLTLQGHTGVVRSAAFSADGQRIITASDDQTAKVWDVASGKALLTLQGHTGVVWSAAFSANGQRIVTASDDQTARTWFSSVEAYIAAARRLVQRDPPVFTAEERQQYGLDELAQLLGTPVAPSTPVAKP